MTKTIALDWLAVYGYMGYEHQGIILPFPELPRQDGYTYERMPYGTRQYSQLWQIKVGKELFCEVQRAPYSPQLHPAGCIVKFANRVLYTPDAHELIARFLDEHYISVQSVSRCDVCCDFQRFHTMTPHELIVGFASMTLRHIGRGDGACYFEHDAHKDPVTKVSEYYMHYSGISFGSKSSDIRVYLYNKTKELAEVKDKPYIRDTWAAAGMVASATHPVWRLEVSISGKGTTFRDAKTDDVITIVWHMLFDALELARIFFTFIDRYFQFVKNRPGIRNITREPRIKLFDDTAPIYDRRVLRSVSGGNRSEKIAIHKLWQMSEEYRAMDNESDRKRTQQLAQDLATATDLGQWLEFKQTQWPEKPRKI